MGCNPDLGRGDNDPVAGYLMAESDSYEVDASVEDDLVSIPDTADTTTAVTSRSASTSDRFSQCSLDEALEINTNPLARIIQDNYGLILSVM